MEGSSLLILIFWIILYPFLHKFTFSAVAAKKKTKQDICTKEWEIRHKTGL